MSDIKDTLYNWAICKNIGFSHQIKFLFSFTMTIKGRSYSCRSRPVPEGVLSFISDGWSPFSLIKTFSSDIRKIVIVSRKIFLLFLSVLEAKYGAVCSAQCKFYSEFCYLPM